METKMKTEGLYDYGIPVRLFVVFLKTSTFGYWRISHHRSK